MFYVGPIFFYQFILKPVTTHAYLIPKGNLLVEYAAFGKHIYSTVFTNLNLTGIALKDESILHFLLVRNEVFPNMQVINKNITMGIRCEGVYLVTGLSS